MKKKAFILLMLSMALVLAAGCGSETQKSETKIDNVEAAIVSKEEPKNETLFALTDDEQKTYDLFAAIRDEALLKNLEPISVAKLYIQASLDEDYETEYAFYSTEHLYEGAIGWTLEEHLEISKQDRVTKAYIYEKLVPLVNGEFVKVDENYGYIKYSVVDDETSEALDMGFQMEKDKNGIWKVCFMPIQ